METLTAIAEAEDSDNFENEEEDEFNPENVDPNEEAIEEIVIEEKINKKFTNAKEKLTFYFSPEFIKDATKEYQKRSKELEKRNLPFWNV
jgi:hypothetical protein